MLAGKGQATNRVASVPASGTPSTGRFRWVICALLFFACLINYMDRQILGILKPELSGVFGWSERDYGNIAIAFQASYTIGQILFGPFIDWLGTKSAYAFSVVFWSLAAMSHALARSVPGFCASRFALGLGESGNFPAAIRTTTEWFPPRERSVATGLFNSGANLGAMFGPLLVPLLAIHLGWRGAFIALGLVDLVWLCFWLGLYDPPETSKRVGANELAHIHAGADQLETKIPWTRLLGYREAWGYYGTCVLVGPVWWFYGFWLPDFFNKQFHLNMKQFGPPLVIVYAIAGLGSIMGGAISAWFLKRGWGVNPARKTASLLCACGTLPVILAPRVGSVWLAAGFFALAAAAHQGWSATMYTVVADIFPRRAVASIVGFGGTLASLTTMGFFWLVSTILQNQGQYQTIMLICGSAYVLAWIIFQIAVPQIKPVRIE